jgi:hypothetical protein
MASLRELQYSFAAALRDPAGACPVRPTGNLAIYRNNVEAQFRRALELSFPVVRRRVGDDYFRQLAHHYRAKHPSRSGDLHWVGREFPRFLADHLHGSEYAWLAELARLEWACESALVAEARAAIGAERLSRHAPEALERVVFTLQPSLHLLASTFPVFSVWRANIEGDGPPVDQSVGPEQGMILCRHSTVEVRPVEISLFSFMTQLAAGRTLGESMTAAAMDETGLLQGLQFLFAESLVCAVDSTTEAGDIVLM